MYITKLCKHICFFTILQIVSRKVSNFQILVVFVVLYVKYVKYVLYVFYKYYIQKRI